MTILDHFVLGLFPAFQNGRLGGIEESGRLGWDSITSTTNAALVYYANPAAYKLGEKYHTRLQTVAAVLKIKSQPQTLLVWHVGLMKLVPFIRQHPGKVFLFLHGIETWKKHRWLTRRLLNRVDVFLSNSEFTWQKFLEYNASFHQSRHLRVSLGTGETAAAVAIPRDSPPAALMVSRLAVSEDYKGHREVIAAWPSVQRSNPLAELWIAGDGDLRAELEHAVRELRLEDAVKFLGKVSEEQKHDLLKRCRCLVMPSRGEGFGLCGIADPMTKASLTSNFDNQMQGEDLGGRSLTFAIRIPKISRSVWETHALPLSIRQAPGTSQCTIWKREIALATTGKPITSVNCDVTLAMSLGHGIQTRTPSWCCVPTENGG